MRLAVPVVNAISPSAVPEDAPTNIAAFVLSPSSIRVEWAPPTIPNGAITNYTVNYSSPSSSANISLGGRARSHDLTGLRPHTNYTVRVSAHTLVGEGPRGPEEGVVVATEQDGMCVCMFSQHEGCGGI